MDRLTGPTGPRCRCGNRVSRKIARVFGIDGEVPVCEECYVSINQSRTYATTFAALRAYRQGTGYVRGGEDD